MRHGSRKAEPATVVTAPPMMDGPSRAEAGLEVAAWLCLFVFVGFCYLGGCRCRLLNFWIFCWCFWCLSVLYFVVFFVVAMVVVVVLVLVADAVAVAVAVCSCPFVSLLFSDLCQNLFNNCLLAFSKHHA